MAPSTVEAAGPSPAVANVEDGGGSCAIAAVSTSILPSPAGGSGGDRIAPAVDTPPCAATGAADGGSPAVSLRDGGERLCMGG